jgi:hypothetical protein
VIACWILATRTRSPRAFLLLVFGLAALPAFILFWYWHGLTPPAVQGEKMHMLRQMSRGTVPDTTSLVYFGAMAAPFALPFLFTRPRLTLPPKAAVVAMAAVVGCFLIVFHGMAFSPLGGGLVTKLGLHLGAIGVPTVIVIAALGWCAIGAVAVSALDNFLLFFLAIPPLLVVGTLYQRYLDPLAFALVLLLVSPSMAQRLATERSVLAGYFFFLGLLVIGLSWFVVLGHAQRPPVL